MRDDMVPGEELRRYICKCSELEEKVAFLKVKTEMLEWMLKQKGSLQAYGTVCFVTGENQIELKVYVKGGD